MKKYEVISNTEQTVLAAGPPACILSSSYEHFTFQERRSWRLEEARGDVVVFRGGWMY